MPKHSGAQQRDWPATPRSCRRPRRPPPPRPCRSCRAQPSVPDEIVVQAVAVDVADRGDALSGAIALAGAVDALVGLVPKIGLAGRDVQPLRRQRRQVAHGDQLVLIGGEAPEARGHDVDAVGAVGGIAGGEIKGPIKRQIARGALALPQPLLGRAHHRPVDADLDLLDARALPGVSRRVGGEIGALGDVC